MKEKNKSHGDMTENDCMWNQLNLLVICFIWNHKWSLGWMYSLELLSCRRKDFSLKTKKDWECLTLGVFTLETHILWKLRVNLNT